MGKCPVQMVKVQSMDKEVKWITLNCPKCRSWKVKFQGMKTFFKIKCIDCGFEFKASPFPTDKWWKKKVS